MTAALISATVVAAAPNQTQDPARKSTEEKPVDLAVELESAKKELAAMLTKFTEEHPRVKEQRRKIAALEAQIATKGSESTAR